MSVRGLPVDSIERLSRSRNFVYVVSSGGDKYTFKAYNEAAGGNFDSEVLVHALLGSSRLVKQFVQVDQRRRFVIARYVDGATLTHYSSTRLSKAAAACGGELEAEVDCIALQVVLLLQTCHQRAMPMYGRVGHRQAEVEAEADCPTWSACVYQYLDRLGARMEAVGSKSKSSSEYLLSQLAVLRVFFAGSTDYLNAVLPRLVPVDLNLDNFVVDADRRVCLVDLESFWSGDILLACADWIANTYLTPLHHAFVRHWGALTAQQSLVVHAYAALSNLSALLYIAETSDAHATLHANISQAKPWGSSHCYVDSISAHLQQLRVCSASQLSLASHHQHQQHQSSRSCAGVGLEQTSGLRLLPSDMAHARLLHLSSCIRQFCAVEFNAAAGEELAYVQIYGLVRVPPAAGDVGPGRRVRR